ncbi:hypothetical protein DUNSADRAFT_9758 [Dunaliella salina]|uniref:Uncharacterized protein n=1 Tax=Dunaliella salina TaxID=3046 RepID=A0ABQ7GGS7_DUNSA|nr:hypothetical protein DUNSADRAFT_9758 [Dunaliella salina]|eukprot:KAF5833811.1 hypothetical protein DUNSADRAFT_9758 [Dunaliella salina]
MTSPAVPPATASRIPPAGAGTKMESIDSASTEVKQLVRQLNKFSTASTLSEHASAMQGFDEDMTLDTPFMQVQGRDKIRVLSSFFKFFLGNFEVEPRLVKISVPEGKETKGGMVELDGIVHWLPHRPWWLLTSYLLPRDIPIYADVSMGVKAHNDKVWWLSGKNHNLPHVPRILRIINGYVAGLGASIAEPAYNTMRDWYSSTADAIGNPSTVTDKLGSTISQVQDAVTDAAGNVTQQVQSVTQRAGEKVQETTSGAAGTAGAVRKTM